MGRFKPADKTVNSRVNRINVDVETERRTEENILLVCLKLPDPLDPVTDTNVPFCSLVGDIDYRKT